MFRSSLWFCKARKMVEITSHIIIQGGINKDMFCISYHHKRDLQLQYKLVNEAAQFKNYYL